MLRIFTTPLGQTGLAALTLLTLGGAAAQAQTGLAVSGDSLYALNLATGTANLVGSYALPSDSLQGLAIAPNGSLFGTGQTGLLYSLSATTGAATLIGDTGRGDIEGLDFFGNTLVGTNNNSTTTFFSIDTATAATTNIVAASTGTVRALDSAGPNTALAVSDSPMTNSLQSIDLTTGAVTTLATLTGTGGGNALSGNIFTGIDVASDGNLYAVDNNGDIDLVDPATGQVTLINNPFNGRGGFLDFKANAAVPEASMTVSFGLLMAIGMGSVVIAAKRRKMA